MPLDTYSVTGAGPRIPFTNVIYIGRIDNRKGVSKRAFWYPSGHGCWVANTSDNTKCSNIIRTLYIENCASIVLSIYVVLRCPQRYWSNNTCSSCLGREVMHVNIYWTCSFSGSKPFNIYRSCRPCMYWNINLYWAEAACNILFLQYMLNVNHAKVLFFQYISCTLAA